MRVCVTLWLTTVMCSPAAVSTGYALHLWGVGGAITHTHTQQCAHLLQVGVEGGCLSGKGRHQLKSTSQGAHNFSLGSQQCWRAYAVYTASTWSLVSTIGTLRALKL